MVTPKHSSYRVAAIQFEPEVGSKARNIERLLSLAGEAAKRGAKLIVLPELATTGYCWSDRREIEPLVEPIPGPTTERFASLTKALDCYIAVGLPEVDTKTNIYYDSLSFLGPAGLIGSYRKVHANVADPRWARDGTGEFPVWQTELGNIGGLICMDLCYFEASRIEALKEADVIMLLANWHDIKAPSPLWMGAAFDNGVYVVAANRWGRERGFQFSGGSSVLNPDGTIQDRLDTGDGIVFGEVNVNRARAKLFRVGMPDHKIQDRAPREYQDLILNTYLWDPVKFQTLYATPESRSGQSATASVVQFHPEKEDILSNFRHMERLMQSCQERPDIVVFPELAPYGMMGAGEARKRAEKIFESQTLSKLTDLASRFSTYVVTTVAELEGEKYYHTAVLVGPKGLRGKYRKIHLNSHEKIWADPGDTGFPFFDLECGRIGLLVGKDILFPEASMCLASSGCDLICVPAALQFPEAVELGSTQVPLPEPIPTEADSAHFLLWRVRAEQCSTYVAISNYHGNGYIGRSGIFAPEMECFPRHELILSADKDEAGCLRIDLSSEGACRKKSILGKRQLYAYEGLLVTQGKTTGA